jgi:hypothetical protein
MQSVDYFIGLPGSSVQQANFAQHQNIHKNCQIGFKTVQVCLPTTQKNRADWTKLCCIYEHTLYYKNV